MTIKDIIADNGFGFMGVGGHSLSMWLLISLLFPLFRPGFLCDRKKLSKLCRSGSYPCLKGVKCAHSEVVSLLDDVIEFILSL